MHPRAVVFVPFTLILASCHGGSRGGIETGPVDVPDTALPDMGEDEGARQDPGVPSDAAEDGDAGLAKCPAQAPISQACTAEGLSCEYGTECCCGQCHPSLVCECQGGLFGCYYTDACLIPGCPDAVDTEEAGDLGILDAGDPGIGHDAGQSVECGSFPPVFPGFDESCQDDHDCVVVFHQVNCCGTEVAWGIAAAAMASFETAEEECRAQYPACGCPAFPTEADDGNTAWDVTQFAVKCKSGECFSYVQGTAPRCHDANDCEPGQMCLAPGEQLPCGICRQPEQECEKDTDCGPDQVCEWVFGSCLCAPTMRCVVRCDLLPGRRLPPCKPAEACVDGHCVALACTTDDDCPHFFWCDPVQETCSRRTCQNDGDCQGGRCVNGACYDALGTCSYIPP